jgi:hypothetical protein
MKQGSLHIKFLGIIALVLVGSSCKKMLDLRPENLTLSEEALKNPSDIQALLNSCYDEFANLMNGSVQNIHELLGENLSEPQNSAGSLYYTIYNRGTFSFRTADREYLDFYNCILRINTIFENIENIPGLSGSEKSRILGEGYFLRAWCHWELVKLWAQPYGFTPDNSHPGVPIRLKADKKIEIRSSVSEVYRQILTDLNTALGLIPEENGNYAHADAVKALKAKVLFIMNDFEASSEISGELINSAKYTLSDSLNRFVQGAPEEVIFQLISTNLNDNRAGSFINNYRSDNNPNPALKPSASFMKDAQNVIDRRSAFFEVKNQGNVNQFFINLKFNKDVFHVPLLHYTDIILMHAESLTEIGGDLTQAIALIDGIRKRAYGNEFIATNPSISASELRSLIQKERKIEMAFEGDWTQQLRRRGAKGENITIRLTPWNCPGMLIQFPMSEKTAGFKFNEEGGCQ